MHSINKKITARVREPIVASHVDMNLSEMVIVLLIGVIMIAWSMAPLVMNPSDAAFSTSQTPRVEVCKK